jgi:hypothetical protein
VKKQQWISIMILIWVMLVISAYYVTHKPVSSFQLMVWGRAAGQILCSGAVLLLAGGIGRWIFPLSELEPQESLVLQGAVGLGVLGTGLLGWGVLVGYQRWVLLGLFAAMLVVFVRSWLGWAREISKLREKFLGSRRIDQYLTAVVLAIMGAGLLRALAPPLKFDSLVYHLALPFRYLRHTGFYYVPDNVYWGMPQVQEMLFVLSMAAAGVEAGPVLSWWIGVFSLLSVYLLVHRYSGSTSAWVAVLTLISGLTTARSLSWGYTLWLNVLWGSSFLMVLGNRELISTDDRPGQRKIFIREPVILLLAGLTAGFALGTKYTSGVLVLIGLGVLIWEMRGGSYLRFWKRAGVFLLGVGAAFIPWLVKNLVAVGNPLYPFFFPAGAMDSWRQSIFSHPEGALDFWQILGMPITSTVLGVEGAPGFAASIGPLFLALGAVAFLPGVGKPKHRSLLRSAKLIILGGFLIWAGAGTTSVHLSQTRLYAVLFPAGAVLAGTGFERLGKFNFSRVRLQVLILGLILMVGVFNAIQIGTEDARAGTFDHFLGVINDQEYLANNLGWYAAAVDDLQAMSEDSRLVMLWEPRGYYCLPMCDSDEILDRWHHDLRVQGSGEDVVLSWLAQGYSHLLYHRAGADFVRSTDGRFSAETWNELDDLLKLLPMVEDYGGDYQLYRLEAP